MVIKTLVVVAVIVYIFVNAATSRMISAQEMHRHFIHGQCMVGKICANIFYGPAWILKGIKFAVNATIK